MVKIPTLILETRTPAILLLFEEPTDVLIFLMHGHLDEREMKEGADKILVRAAFGIDVRLSARPETS